jgi:hypothetical protein
MIFWLFNLHIEVDIISGYVTQSAGSRDCAGVCSAFSPILIVEMAPPEHSAFLIA